MAVRRLSTVCCQLLLVTWLCIIGTGRCVGAATLNSTQLRWTLQVLHSQTVLSQNVSIQKQPLCGSQASGFHFDALPLRAQRAERALAQQPSSTFSVSGYTLTGRLQLAEQCYRPRTQLELGVRHLHLELHLVNNEAFVCKSQKAFCESLTTATQDHLACESIFGWQNLGNSTGCHAASPTFAAVLKEISDWVEGNPDEVILVRLHAGNLLKSIGSCGYTSHVDDAIEFAFSSGSSPVFSPIDWTAFGGGSLADVDWPSAWALKKMSKNIIFLSQCAFSNRFVHGYGDVHFLDPGISEFPVAGFRPSPFCQPAGMILPSNIFDFVYGDRFLADFTISGPRLRASKVTLTSGAGTMTVPRAREVVRCNISPMMSGFGQSAAKGCIWTYREGHSAYCQPNLCTVMSRYPNDPSRPYDWYNIPCAIKRKLLCRERSVEATWSFSALEWAYPTTEHLDIPTYPDANKIEQEICPAGYNFVVPKTPVEAEDVLHQMTQINISEIWLGWHPHATCRAGGQTTLPVFKLPDVSSFNCPEAIKEPYIYQPSTTQPPTAGTQPRETGSQNQDLSNTELIGIIVGCLVIFTLLLVILYLAVVKKLTSAHDMSRIPQSSPGPTLMHARRQISSMGGFGRSSGGGAAVSGGTSLDRLHNDTTALLNDSSPASPSPSSMGPLFSNTAHPFSNAQAQSSLPRSFSHISHNSPADVQPSLSRRVPDFPVDIAPDPSSPMHRFTSTSSGIPGVTEEEGIVRVNPLFAAQAAEAGDNDGAYDDNETDGGDSQVDGLSQDTADGGVVGNEAADGDENESADEDTDDEMAPSQSSQPDVGQPGDYDREDSTMATAQAQAQGHTGPVVFDGTGWSAQAVSADTDDAGQDSDAGHSQDYDEVENAEEEDGARTEDQGEEDPVHDGADGDDQTPDLDDYSIPEAPQMSREQPPEEPDDPYDQPQPVGYSRPSPAKQEEAHVPQEMAAGEQWGYTGRQDDHSAYQQQGASASAAAAPASGRAGRGNERGKPMYRSQMPTEQHQQQQQQQQQQPPQQQPPQQEPKPKTKKKKKKEKSQSSFAPAPQEDLTYGLPMDAPMGLLAGGEVFY